MGDLAHTTPGELRAAFETAIKAITADHPEHGTRWRVMKQLSEVPGPDVRKFFIECGRATPVQGGIFCGGCEYKFDMEIWTSYGALASKHDDSIVTHDAQQLYQTLANLYATLSGLTMVEPLGWRDGEGAESGRLWGAHQFEIHYFADV